MANSNWAGHCKFSLQTWKSWGGWTQIRSVMTWSGNIFSEIFARKLLRFGTGCRVLGATERAPGASWPCKVQGGSIPICKQDDGRSWCRWVVGASWSLEKHFLINWATKENAAFPGIYANWEPCWCNFGSAAARSTWEWRIANVNKMKWSGPKGIMERWRLNQCLGFGELRLFKKHTFEEVCYLTIFYLRYWNASVEPGDFAPTGAGRGRSQQSVWGPWSGLLLGDLKNIYI